MAYAPPSIGPAGLTVPSYPDIAASLTAQYRQIFGQSVYLGTDSADYQWIAAVAVMINDVLQAAQFAYNSRSPATAVGAGLDSVVKCNGIARKSATYSSCVVTLSGTPDAIINNGVVRDTNGNVWDLPTLVAIPASGSISVPAISEVPGAVAAASGQLNTIATPTAGWVSVTNTDPAVPGQPIEPDGSLRARQAISVALPSLTMLAGTIAGIAAVSGVTRYSVLENPTNQTDSYGNPPHSISCVIEGGTDGAVAQTIYNNRGIGCYTNGTTVVTVTDQTTGYQLPIRFFRPVYAPIYVSLAVHGISGFTTATQAAIKAAIAAYLNSLQIGELVTISGLYGAALAVMPNLSMPVFSIRSLTAGTAAGSLSGNDINLTYSQVASGATNNITLTVV